jgi:glycosyltransferase involved in cell wall biosynthesis
MFCPGQTDKRYDVAFVGSMYQKRVEYARNLLARLDGRIDFRCGSVTVRDLSGECQKLWAELLADNLRQIRVHLCLPSANSRMMVARPLETMACGTFCLTYRTPDHPFTSEQCATYDPAAIDSLIDQLRYYLDHEEERERIAAAGCREVHAHWSLPERMREVLSAMTE